MSPSRDPSCEQAREKNSHYNHNRRLWIVQEAVLSTDTFLTCNGRSINLDIFIAAASWLICNDSGLSEEVNEKHQYPDATSFIDVVRIASTPDMLTLGRILYPGIMLQCSEPRDRVFGLLSLLKVSTRKRLFPVDLAPNYTRSVVDVYCDATRACLDDCEDPCLLDSCGYGRSSDNFIKGLPTWVPSWYYGRLKCTLCMVSIHSPTLPEYGRTGSTQRRRLWCRS